jgi:hypothetical protein
MKMLSFERFLKIRFRNSYFLLPLSISFTYFGLMDIMTASSIHIRTLGDLSFYFGLKISIKSEISNYLKIFPLHRKYKIS